LEEVVFVLEKAIIEGEEEDLIADHSYTPSLVMPCTRGAPV
jgi:hypothetical protein